MTDCEVCGLVIDPIEEKNYCICSRIECPLCHYRDLTSKFKMVEDNADVGGETVYECPECKKSFDDNSDVYRQSW